MGFFVLMFLSAIRGSFAYHRFAASARSEIMGVIDCAPSSIERHPVA